MYYKIIVAIQEGKLGIDRPELRRIPGHRYYIPLHDLVEWIIRENISYPVEMEPTVRKLLQSGKKRSTQQDKALALQIAKQRVARKNNLTITEVAGELKKNTFPTIYTEKTIQKWIAPAWPKELRKRGRPSKGRSILKNPAEKIRRISL